MPAGKIRDKRIRILRTYSICVGINEFIEPNLQLNGCVRDAKAISKAFACDYPIVLLDKEASRKRFLNEVDRLVNKLGKGDLLLISISSHGTVVNNDLAIMMADSHSKEQLATTLSTYYLMSALKALADKGGKVLIIIDACHSGALNFETAKYTNALSGGGIAAIYSCGPKELAKEMQFDGESQGIFTYYFVKGLEEGTALDAYTPPASLITLRDLYDYIYFNVKKKVKDQHPSLIGTLEGNTILKRLGKKRSKYGGGK